MVKMTQKRVLVLCVHYKNTDEVRRFVRAVAAQRLDTSLSLMVVDNSGELLRVSNLDTDGGSRCEVTVLDAGSNIGYYGAAAFAMDRYLKTAVMPDWVVVCNTDIEFAGSDFFARLSALHDRRAVTVVTPRIITSKGEERIEFTRMRPSARRLSVYQWILDNRWVSFLYHAFIHLKVKSLDWWRGVKANRGHHRNAVARRAPFAVYAPAGSFACFSRGYFEAGGDLRHGAFLYGEEVFVAETCKRIGGQVLFDPRLAVVHQGFSTTNVFRVNRVVDFKRDAVRFYRNAFFKE